MKHGIKPDGVSSQSAEETFARNLEYAARILGTHDIQLMAEAINTQDLPGFFLNTSKQLIDLKETSLQQVKVIGYLNNSFGFKTVFISPKESHTTLSQAIPAIRPSDGHIEKMGIKNFSKIQYAKGKTYGQLAREINFKKSSSVKLYDKSIKII